MAAIKTTAIGVEPAPRYHVVDIYGNHVVLKQIVQAQALPSSQNAPSVNALAIDNGGNRIVLSQQNATDLATAISGFGSGGSLT